MDEYLCLTVRSKSGESLAEFKSRMYQLWTNMLRNHESDFEKVYAESTAVSTTGDTHTRQYMIEAEVAPRLLEQIAANGFDFDPIDEDEIYSRYEAAPPDWFQLEH